MWLSGMSDGDSLHSDVTTMSRLQRKLWGLFFMAPHLRQISRPSGSSCYRWGGPELVLTFLFFRRVALSSGRKRTPIGVLLYSSRTGRGLANDAYRTAEISSGTRTSVSRNGPQGGTDEHKEHSSTVGRPPSTGGATFNLTGRLGHLHQLRRKAGLEGLCEHSVQPGRVLIFMEDYRHGLDVDRAHKVIRFACHKSKAGAVGGRSPCPCKRKRLIVHH